MYNIIDWSALPVRWVGPTEGSDVGRNSIWMSIISVEVVKGAE